MKRKLFRILFAGVAFVLVIATRAQSPVPELVAAQTANATAAPAPVSPSAGNESAQATIKLLQEMKAANEETLKKQQAALDTLDDLQKEAEKRRHADAQHTGGFLPRPAAVREGSVDVAALLLLDEFIQALTNRHRRNCLLRFFSLCGADNLRRQIARQDQIFIAQGAGTLDRVFQLAHVTGVVVMTKAFNCLRIDFFRLAACRARLLLQEVIH